MNIAVFHNLPRGGARRVVDHQLKLLGQKYRLKLFRLRPVLSGSRLARDYANFVSLNRSHQKIAAAINRGGFDVCLLHPDQLTQAPFLLPYLTIPSVYYCHELLRLAYEPELAAPSHLPLANKAYEAVTRKLRKTIDKANARAAKLILVNSKATQKNVKKAYQRSSTVCYPGVDGDVFRAGSVPKKNQLVFVAAKAKITGFDLAKQALALIEKKIRPELKVVDKFSLTYRGLGRAYSQSLASLCLSANEPFGLTAIESMACQTPVIAIDQGGYRETVVDQKTGFLVKNSPQALAEKIIYLIKNPRRAQALGSAGRRRVENNFTWDNHLAILEQSLLKLARK